VRINQLFLTWLFQNRRQPPTAGVNRLFDEHKWYQVWIDEHIFYVLILFGTLDGDFAAYDPIEGRVIERFESLDEAEGWLSEDEYNSVSPRLKDLDEYKAED
jgi:hypothetical protein